MFFAVLYTDGELTPKDVREECIKNKWASILSYKKNNDNIPIIPLFYCEKDAKSFFERNIPKKWTRGTVCVTKDEVSWMEQQGWAIEYLNFPKLIKGKKDIKIGLEIMEFKENPIYRETKQFC